MGHESVYGPSFPCLCGRGKVQYWRTEHDTHPGKPRQWSSAEIECEDCAAAYVIRKGRSTMYYVPVAEADRVTWSNADDGGFVRVPEPDW